MADVDSPIDAAEVALQQSKKAEEDLKQRSQDIDRSFMAKLIVMFFVGLIGAIVVAVVAGLWYFCDWEKIAEPAKFLASILSSVLLPVVTLVIGYYFGSKT